MHCISIDGSTENRGKINTVYVIPFFFFISFINERGAAKRKKFTFLLHSINSEIIRSMDLF